MTETEVHYLVVFLHRFISFQTEEEVWKECESLISFTKQTLNQSTLLPLSNKIGFFTSGSFDTYINQWLKQIDHEYDRLEKELPDKTIKIVFIGHSMGGILARKLYVCACGNNAEAPLEKGIDAGEAPRRWAPVVERLVLFAGMNNGWNPDFHNGIKRSISLMFGITVGNLLSYIHRKPLLLTMRRGGSFVTQLRLQTIAMLAHSGAKNAGGALTVQLLGSSDDLVSPQDDIDDIGGNSFVYKEVPYSNHNSLIKLDATTENSTNNIGIVQLRKDIIFEVLTVPQNILAATGYTIPAFKNITVDEKVTDVVFVVHGIRDLGYWTLKVGNRILSAAKKLNAHLPPDDQRKFAIETASYGYFPLLQFALPGSRNGKVGWLMERYVANKIKYPNASFSFVGHSNGTFLIAKAMADYQACKFKHVVLAGSVLNRKLRWQDYIVAKRVEKIHNIVAASDYVVGIFPQAMHSFFNDLGAAGYWGFDTLLPPQQTEMIRGGHGAGVAEIYWDQIADFIVNGRFQQPIAANAPKRKFSISQPFSVIIFSLLFILFFIAIPLLIIAKVEGNDWRVITLILYGFLLWKFLTRF